MKAREAGASSAGARRKGSAPLHPHRKQDEPSGWDLFESEQADLVRLRDVLPSLIFDNERDITPEALVRGVVVREYALVDANLTTLLFLYYFGLEQRDLQAAVDRGRFLSFYELVENVSLVQKLKHLHTILDIPKDVGRRIKKINDVRNAVAHVAIAEVSTREKFRYSRERLLSEAGVRKFLYDVRCTNDYLNGTRSKLYQGEIEFARRGRLLSPYQILSVLFPDVRSCAVLADDPDTPRG